MYNSKHEIRCETGIPIDDLPVSLEFATCLQCVQGESFEKRWAVHIVERFVANCHALSGEELRRLRHLTKSFLMLMGEFQQDDYKRKVAVRNVARFLTHPVFVGRHANREFWGEAFLETVEEMDPLWSAGLRKMWEMRLAYIFSEVECARRALRKEQEAFVEWPKAEVDQPKNVVQLNRNTVTEAAMVA